MENQITISDSAIFEAYENGTQENKKLLERLFGTNRFKPKNIINRIEVFEDAVVELGERHPFVISYYTWIEYFSSKYTYMLDTEIAAYLKLRIICAALNEGWEPEFLNDNTDRYYYPYFKLYSQEEIDAMSKGKKKESLLNLTVNYRTEYEGFTFEYSISAPSHTVAHIVPHLCLKNEQLADYCGLQFIDLWADFYLIRRR